MLGELTQRQPRVLQIIGLPGSGKTTAIEATRKSHPGSFSFLDIRNYQGKQYDRLLLDIQNLPSPVVVESACGVRSLPKDIVILIDTPFHIACQRCHNRDGHVDSDYMSLLTTQLLGSTHKTTSDGLPTLLMQLLRIPDEDSRASC